MSIREAILQSLRSELGSSDQVLAFWEAGSRAMGRADDLSDLDLMAIVADGAVEAVQQRVEGALERVAPIDLRFLVPQPAWHGHWQAFYRLEGVSPLLLVDICLMERKSQNWFLEPEMHGQAALFFDKEGLVRPEPTPALPFAERLAKRLPLLEVYTEMFHRFVDKELDRGRVVDALSYYQGMIMPRVLEALRMRHAPWRYNFGMRYLNDDLPPVLYEQVRSLVYVAGPEELPAKKEQALALLRATLAELKGLDLVALLEATRS